VAVVAVMMVVAVAVLVPPVPIGILVFVIQPIVLAIFPAIA